MKVMVGQRIIVNMGIEMVPVFNSLLKVKSYLYLLKEQFFLVFIIGVL